MEKIGEYRVTAELGRGGMGVVYRAHDPQLDREVAIKVLLTATSPRHRVRFLTEARALARLRHPHIVDVFHVGEHGAYPYIVMDFVEGESLQDRLARQGRLPPREAATIARKLAGALEYAHASGVLHRDVKPDNVIVNEQGEPRLTDFGLAKDLLDSSGRRLSTTGQLMGTPGFWPPEQATGKVDQIGPWSDVYALGATLYTLLAGEPPFQTASTWEDVQATVVEKPAPPSTRGVRIDLDLERICLRCLEKAPADRFHSAGALAEALDRYLRGERASSLSPGMLLGVGALIVLLAVAVGILAWQLSSVQERLATVERDQTVRSTPAPALTRVEVETPQAEVSESQRAEAKAWIERGRTAQQIERSYEAAYESYSRAIEIDPGLAEAWVGRGVARFSLGGDIPGAIEDYERALAADPSSFQAHLHRGIALLNLGHDQAAMSDLTRAMELEPERGDPLTWVGMIHMRKRDYAEAVRAFTRALELLPQDDPVAKVVRLKLLEARQALGP